MKPELIRAARGALNWSQTELAERADVHFQTIVSIEKGTSTPSSATLNKIQQAFERNGLQVEKDSLRLSRNSTYEISGNDWYLKLLDDVYHSLKDTEDAEFLLISTDDRVSPPEVNDSYRKIRKSGIRMRQLVEEGNTYLMGNLNEYRYIPKKHFTNYVCLIYGDKFAVCTNENTKAVVFKDVMLSMMWTNVFNTMWDSLIKPEVSNAKERF